jgi:hypothetical protein
LLDGGREQLNAVEIFEKWESPKSEGYHNNVVILGRCILAFSLSLLGIEVPARRIYCLDTLYVMGSLNLTWCLLGMMGLKWSSQGEET